MKYAHAIAVLLLAILPAFAGQEEKRKLAAELLKRMKFERNMEQSFAVARQMQMAQLKSMTLSNFDAAAARDVREKAMNYLQQELSWKNLKEEFVTAYADVFTEDELRGLVEFYKSPAGQSYVEKVPTLMQRSGEITQKRMVEIGPKIRSMVGDAAEEHKANAPLMLRPESRAPANPESAK